MKVLDILPQTESSFALNLSKPFYKNEPQVSYSRLTIPYPYHKEDAEVNFNKNIYVIPYIAKYIHNMIEFWPNILFLQKNKIKFTLIVVCSDPLDYDEKNKIPFGWHKTESQNLNCFKELIERNGIPYKCFHSQSKEYLEMCAKSSYIFYDKKDLLYYENILRKYPRDLYFNNYLPHEPCVTQTSFSLIPKLKYLYDWAPKNECQNKKIYISRGNYESRKIDDESKIIEYVNSIGYETVYFENHSVTEQIRIVQEASHIIVPSGASLFNCMFANPGTQIFEIETEPYDVGIYEHVFKMYNIVWYKKKYHLNSGEEVVFQLKNDLQFQNAFVAQRTEQDSSKVLVAGSTPAEGAE